jgi:hypothetical protein
MMMTIQRRLSTAYNRAMDWCASWLPGPKPIGMKLFGYDVTRLDLTVAIGGILIGVMAAFWYGSWGWFFIGVLLFAMMWIWMW